MESYKLTYRRQTEKAILVSLPKHIIQFWLPKSVIEVDGIMYEEDFDNLEPMEEIEVYIPDWLAEEKELI